MVNNIKKNIEYVEFVVNKAERDMWSHSETRLHGGAAKAAAESLGEKSLSGSAEKSLGDSAPAAQPGPPGDDSEKKGKLGKMKSAMKKHGQTSSNTCYISLESPCRRAIVVFVRARKSIQNYTQHLY